MSLSSLGFEFNPFEYLEASNDPYLQEYLIGHELFAIAWEKEPALIFAPAGGGKTAMRIYTLRACWLGESQRRKFPISYDISFFKNTVAGTDHLSAMAAAAATDIFLTCAYRPWLYLELTLQQRRNILSFLSGALPNNLEWCLAVLEESANPRELALHLDRAYIIPDLPPAHAIVDFCTTVRADLKGSLPVILPENFLQAAFEIIKNDLGFESIFLLVDGIDGTPGIAENPDSEYAIFEPVFTQSQGWVKEKIYIKAFLPQELEPLVKKEAQSSYKSMAHATITWDVPKLAEILRRRVYVASRGKMGSLDAISSPALRDVETLIARKAPPLPREAIILASEVLKACLGRKSDAQLYIEPEDIELAVNQYRRKTLFQ